MGKENEQVMDDLITNLNDVSNNAGVVGFKIKYAAIPSNKKTHEEFVKFAFDEANNNYLTAINILLKYKDIFRTLDRLENEMSEVKDRMELLKEFVLVNSQIVKEEVKEEKGPKRPKTF